MPDCAQGYDVVADTLAAGEIRDVFGLLGGGNLALVTRMVRDGATFHSSRHESGAVCMAIGASLATGRPPLATVTRGPGLANAVTALTTAARDHVPLVLLVPAPGPEDHANPQRTDHAQVAAMAGVGHVACSDGAHLRSSVEYAFQRAVTEARPVLLDIRADVLHAPAEEQREDASRASLTVADTGTVDPAALDEAARLLVQASRPVVLAGRGAVRSAAGGTLRSLAAEVGALLAATMPALGLFGDEPFHLGLAGGFACQTSRRLLGDADVILAVGTSLSQHTTAGGTLFPRARVVRCDTDPDVLTGTSPPHVGLYGDATTVAEALRAAVARLPSPGDEGYRTSAVRDAIASSRRGGDYPERDGSPGVDPRALLRVLDDALHERSRVVVDVGHFSTFPFQTLSVHRPGQVLAPYGFGAVGLALATAIGVAVTCPEEQIVALIGDGGLLMSLSELETLRRRAPRLCVVVLNDDAYGAEVHHLRRQDLPEGVAHFGTTDFAAIAEALGIEAITIRSRDDLTRLPAFIADRTGPGLIDARVDRAVVADKFQLATERR